MFLEQDQNKHEDKSEDKKSEGLDDVSGPTQVGAFTKRTYKLGNTFNPQIKRAIIQALLAEESGDTLTDAECTHRVLMTTSSTADVDSLEAIPGISGVTKLTDNIYSASFDVRNYKDVRASDLVSYVEGKMPMKLH